MPANASTVGTKTAILRYLKDHGSATRAELIEFLGMTHQNISYHLSTLEEAGFVYRSREARPYTWHLTDNGRVVFDLAPFEDYVGVLLPLMFGLAQITAIGVLFILVPGFTQHPLFYILTGGFILSIVISVAFMILRFRTRS